MSWLAATAMNKDTQLLEAGCGTGLILNRLTQHAKVAVVLTCLQACCVKASARSLQVVQGSVKRAAVCRCLFDVVCSFKVLAHVEPIEQTMRR